MKHIFLSCYMRIFLALINFGQLDYLIKEWVIHVYPLVTI